MFVHYHIYIIIFTYIYILYTIKFPDHTWTAIAQEYWAAHFSVDTGKGLQTAGVL